MAIEPAGDLAHAELLASQVVDHKPLFTCKLLVGHGGLLLAVEKVALLTLPDAHCVLLTSRWCGLNLNAPAAHRQCGPTCAMFDTHFRIRSSALFPCTIY